MPDEPVDDQDAVLEVNRAFYDAFERRDPSVHDDLRAADRMVNSLAHQLWTGTVAADLPSETKMELALIARFYERLGDHAVNVAGQVRYLATGGFRASDAV